MNCIEFDKVAFSYDDEHRALDDLTLNVRTGEFVCVIGCNGSGKTTLAQHVNALVLPDDGSVKVFGRCTSEPLHKADIRQNVGMVFQNPDDQIVASLVEDDVAFGPANLGITGSELRNRVSSALEKAGLQGFERRSVMELSGGQKQLVSIAGALAMEPRVLVLDEATSMLDPQARARLLRLCRALNDDGLSIILITHSLEEASLADRVIALHQGKVALDGPAAQVLGQSGELEAIGLEAPFYLSEDAPTRPALSDGDTCIELEEVSFAYAPDQPNVLDSLTLSVRRGELLGITGSNGTGKSTLVQLMCGLLQPTAGRVTLDGCDLSEKRQAKQARRKIGMALQQPEHQLFATTVFDDVAFGPRNQNLSAQQVESHVADALNLVGLDPAEMGNRNPFALSGGEQRRVALAGVLALKPEVLVLDEPTAGLDPRARNMFLKLIRDLNRTHSTTVVMVSHDVDYLDHLCDRVYALPKRATS